MNRSSQRIAFVTAAVHGLVHACVLLLPPLIVDLRAAFGVSLLAVAAVANGMYLAFGLSAVPGGWLADRLGSRRVLALSAGGCALATGAAALAPSFAFFAAALVVLGACAGLHHPSGLSLVSRGVPGGDRGRALGIHGLGGSLGEALGPVGAALAARAFGWRFGFATASLLALACVVFISATLRASPGPPVLAPRGGAALRSRPRSPLRSGVAEIAEALRGFWRSPPLRWLLLASLAGGFVYRGVLTFLPLHIADQTAGGALPGAGVITLVLLAGTAAQLLGGSLADRSSSGTLGGSPGPPALAPRGEAALRSGNRWPVGPPALAPRGEAALRSGNRWPVGPPVLAPRGEAALRSGNRWPVGPPALAPRGEAALRSGNRWPVGPPAGNRWPMERLFVVELMLFAPVLLLLGLGTGTWALALAVGFGFLWSLTQPLGAALAATHAEARDHGLLYGVQLALSFGLGSFATTLGAALTTWGGTRLAFLGFGAAGIVQLAAAIGVLRTSPGATSRVGSVAPSPR